MFVFSLGLTFTACSSDDDDPVNLTLENGTASVEAGSEVIVKITNGNGGYTAKSSAETTATVKIDGSNVVITGVAAGSADVTVSDKEGKSQVIKVTVTAAPVEITLEKTEATVEVGTDVTIAITQGNGTYTVASSAEAKATAKIEDNKVVITGVASGEATLTVTDAKGKTATIAVTVVNYAEEIAATYEGDLTLANFMGMGDIVLPNEIILSKGDDNNLKLSIASLTIPIGDGIVVTGIAVNSVPLTKSGDTYTLAETQEKITIMVGGVLPQDATVTVNGTVTTAGKIDLTIDVADVETLPTGLAITFDGTKKAN
jgi:hypothetical protein